MTDIDSILIKINSVYDKNEIINKILELLKSEKPKNPNEVNYITSIESLGDVSSNQLKFEEAMGINANIVTSKPLDGQKFKEKKTKSINKTDFEMSVSMEQRKELLWFYIDDIKKFRKEYVNEDGVSVDDLAILTRKLAVLSLQFHITASLPELPIQLNDSIGETMGFRKMIANLLQYLRIGTKPKYDIMKLKKNEITVKELNDMINELYKKGEKFFKTLQEYAIEQKNIIEQIECGFDFRVGLPADMSKSNIKTNFTEIVSKKDILDKVSDNSVKQFINDDKQPGIIIFANKDAASRNLVLIRAVTKIYGKLDKDTEKEIADLFNKNGLDALMDIRKIRDEKAWRYICIAEYVYKLKISEIINWNGFNNLPVELYWDYSSKNLIAISGGEQKVKLCLLNGNVNNITGEMLQTMRKAVERRKNQYITFIDVSATTIFDDIEVIRNKYAFLGIKVSNNKCDASKDWVFFNDKCGDNNFQTFIHSIDGVSIKLGEEDVKQYFPDSMNYKSIRTGNPKLCATDIIFQLQKDNTNYYIRYAFDGSLSKSCKKQNDPDTFVYHLTLKMDDKLYDSTGTIIKDFNIK